MAALSKQAIIVAPMERVFRYVADPHNAPRFISSILRVVSGPEGAPQEGQVWSAEANFLGRRNLIKLRLAEMRPNTLVRFTIEGEPHAILSVQLTSNDSHTQTRTSLLLEVPGVPAILLNGLMSGLLDADLARLKGIMEG